MNALMEGTRGFLKDVKRWWLPACVGGLMLTILLNAALYWLSPEPSPCDHLCPGAAHSEGLTR